MGQLQKIDHTVVLMLENRSFDCLLGKLYPKSDNFEGLSGNEQNPDANGSPVPVWCQKRTLPYSTTSSASAISEGGTVRPRALAALRLITKSNLVDCTYR
jgi:phospholipase C